jgi:hypothetical protein
VPALLSGLAGMASRGEGARKLADVLSGIDAGSMGNFASLLGGDSGALMQRGTGLLNSLFGDGLISGIAGAVSRYSGMNIESAKRLLAFLMPLVLGKVAAQWRSQGGTVGALTGLFADERRNIADAVPAGFSLTDIPGLAGAGEAVRDAATTTTRRTAETAEAATGSLASWLLPLAVLIVGGLLLWNFLKPRPGDQPVAQDANREAAPTTVMKPVVPDAANRDLPAMPTAAQMTESVRSVLTSFNEQLGAIRDAASAEAAAPRLEELKTKLDGIRAAWTRLPEADRPALRDLISAQIDPLKQKAQETLALPGLSDRIKALINDILQRLSELVSPAAQPAATPPERR